MKLYVLVRLDLEKSSPAVQAGHAVAEFMLKNPDSKWRNSYLIYLGVKNLDRLEQIVWRLEKERDIIKFHEPDLNDQLTAIAIESDHKLFKNLRLL